MNSQTFIPVDDLFEVLDRIQNIAISRCKGVPDSVELMESVIDVIERIRSEYEEPKGDCCG